MFDFLLKSVSEDHCIYLFDIAIIIHLLSGYVSHLVYHNSYQCNRKLKKSGSITFLF